MTDPIELITRPTFWAARWGLRAGGAGFHGALRGPAPGIPSRIRESFDFGWKFVRDEIAGAEEPAFADAGWRNLDLPQRLEY